MKDRTGQKDHVIYVVLLSLFIAVVFGGCGSDNGKAKAEYTFKFGHLANEDNIWHKAALRFSESIKEKSAGRIEVKVYPNEQLGKELDMIRGIQAGTVDMTITAESLQNWVPITNLCGAPYAIQDYDQLNKVAGGEIGEKIETAIREKSGLSPIAWFARGARHLTSNRPIKHPDDLKGIILRVPNVPLFVNVWDELGAKPTPMAFSEVFTSLQQGTIQAQENPFSLIESAGFYEVQKYVNLTGHVIGWIYVVVGEKKFKSMPEDLQQIFLECGREMQVYHQQLFLDEEERLQTALQEKGMTMVKVDKMAFQKRARKAVLENMTDEQKDLYLNIINLD